MRCPKCDGKIQTIDSRPRDGDTQIIRRRKRCTECKHRFSTLEIICENLSNGHRRMLATPMDLSPMIAECDNLSQVAQILANQIKGLSKNLLPYVPESGDMD